jgi:hypothetical protein
MVCGEQGELEQVKLQRMAKSLIADKTKMFDLFTRILDRSQKGKDSELIKYVQEATDFWTQMMLEEHQGNNQIFIRKMNDMQDVCSNLLDELLLILEGRAICVAREGTYAGAGATEASQVDAFENTVLQGQVMARQSKPVRGQAFKSKIQKLKETTNEWEALLPSMTEASVVEDTKSCRSCRSLIGGLEDLKRRIVELENMNKTYLEEVNVVCFLVCMPIAS